MHSILFLMDTSTVDCCCCKCCKVGVFKRLSSVVIELVRKIRNKMCVVLDVSRRSKITS